MKQQNLWILFSLIAISLLAYFIIQNKDNKEKLTRVNDKADDINEHLDQVRLAVACMIQDNNMVEAVERVDIPPVGFKLGQNNS